MTSTVTKATLSTVSVQPTTGNCCHFTLPIYCKIMLKDDEFAKFKNLHTERNHQF